MKRRSVCFALLTAAFCLSNASHAQTTLVYSFESLNPGPDGFFGLGATVSQDTIGATEQSHSLKYQIGAGGFVGARTETVIPAAMGDPPGVQHVLFDLTLTEAYAGTFADIGITLFGHALNAPGGAEFGHQVQFANVVSIAALGVGTHTDLQIDLDLSLGPYRPGESFDDIFGPGSNDLTVASAFQFFVSKNVSDPLTFYIDNVRLVVPAPATVLLLGFAGGAATLRRRGLTKSS